MTFIRNFSHRCSNHKLRAIKISFKGHVDRVESVLENQMDIIIQARFQVFLENRSNMSRSLFLALAIFTPTQNENPTKFNRVKAAKDSSDVQF